MGLLGFIFLVNLLALFWLTIKKLMLWLKVRKATKLRAQA